MEDQMDSSKIDKRRINRILIIKLRAVGDVVLSTVVIKNLRGEFPDAVIDFLTEEPSDQVLEGNPGINSIVVFRPHSESGFNLIKRVRRQKYDLVIDLFGNPRSALVTWLSGAEYRVGYRFGWRRYCYNIIVTPRGGEVHNTEFNLDALRAVSVPVSEKSPVFYIEEKDHKFAEDFFKESKLGDDLIVALNPAGGWYTKRWPKSLFARLAQQLSVRHKAKILILWGPGELEQAEEIKNMMDTEAVLIPPATLKQMAAILSHCQLLVTNDSGPMHIASALRVPVVAIFGPTDPVLQGPVGTESVVIRNTDLDCLGCNLTKCPIGIPCMENLSVDDVYSGVESLMQKIIPIRKK